MHVVSNYTLLIDEYWILKVNFMIQPLDTVPTLPYGLGDNMNNITGC